MDSSNVSQNNCSSCWSRGTATKATCCAEADRAAHARSSDVLPLPAGAEISVTFRLTARSSAATSRYRSTRRVPLVLQSAVGSAVTTLLSAADLYCTPLIMWPRRILSAIPARSIANIWRARLTTFRGNLVPDAHTPRVWTPMTSEPIRDPLIDHLLTPQNSALVVIDYQPFQLEVVTLPTKLTLATPFEWRRIGVPRACSGFEPFDQLRRVGWRLSGQCTPGQDPLDGLGHVQPRSAQRGIERHNAVFEQPHHKARCQVAGEVVHDQQQA